jgi:DNA-binding GntR family transcriptional regulator
VPASQRLDRQGTSRRVAEHIRELIFNGTLRAGARIPQDEIAAELGISRLPVREALIALESDGLVQTEPHRGTFVVEVTPTDLRDHYSICGVIHGMAAARAAEVMTRAQFAELRTLNERMLVEDDRDKLYELHWAFHQTINRVGGSRRLRAVLHQLSHNLPQSLFTSISPRDVDAGSIHAAILDALESRDPVRAAELCRTHLENEADLVIKHLREHGLWGSASR